MNEITGILNIFGPIFGLVGTMLIFFFGIPPLVDDGGYSCLVADGADKKRVRKIKFYKNSGRTGLILILLSFLAQLAIELMSLKIL